MIEPHHRHHYNLRDESLRLTFEDTLRRQNHFRRMLEQLIEEKRTLRDDEKEIYLENLFKSLITAGTSHIIYYRLNNMKLIPLGPFIYFAEKMAYQRKPYILIRYNGYIYKIPIEEVWKTILDYSLKLFPLALWNALRLSAERLRVQKPTALEYRPSTRK